MVGAPLDHHVDGQRDDADENGQPGPRRDQLRGGVRDPVEDPDYPDGDEDQAREVDRPAALAPDPGQQREHQADTHQAEEGDHEVGEAPAGAGQGAAGHAGHHGDQARRGPELPEGAAHVVRGHLLDEGEGGAEDAAQPDPGHRPAGQVEGRPVAHRHGQVAHDGDQERQHQQPAPTDPVGQEARGDHRGSQGQRRDAGRQGLGRGAEVQVGRGLHQGDRGDDGVGRLEPGHCAEHQDRHQGMALGAGRHRHRGHGLESGPSAR